MDGWRGATEVKRDGWVNGQGIVEKERGRVEERGGDEVKKIKRVVSL